MGLRVFHEKVCEDLFLEELGVHGALRVRGGGGV